MAPRARMAQERSRQRREQLIDAAIELFSTGGSRAVTHRAVAKLAGLPAATTTYYFESIDQLLREALQQYSKRWTGQMLEPLDLTATHEQVRDLKLVRSLINLILREYPAEETDRDLNIYLACAQDPQLRSVAHGAIAEFERIVARVLASSGLPTPERVAKPMVAACLGFSVRRASGTNDREEADQLARLLVSLVESVSAAEVSGRSAASR